MPIESGKAIASPAMSMPATSSRFAMLKMKPPIIAKTTLLVSAARTLFRKLVGPESVDPSVSA
jgi:hypothetical protein